MMKIVVSSEDVGVEVELNRWLHQLSDLRHSLSPRSLRIDLSFGPTLLPISRTFRTFVLYSGPLRTLRAMQSQLSITT